MEIEASSRVSEKAPEVNVKRTGSWTRINKPLLLLVGFSAIYFADVGLRASEKYFWADEIATLYVCRLPSFASLWEALRHGLDFNPPFFYLLTNASQSIFGEGLVSTRLPQIFAFWILCMSLFQFVRRGSGTIAGIIAMLLPLFTTAFFYAYEARPHGVILGFCGLALVCWQRSMDQSRRRAWLLAFAACLLAGFLMHCYALLIVAPFVLVELFRTLQTRRIDWAMWIALITPAVFACATYVPLLQGYRSLAGGTNFEQDARVTWAQMSTFYPFLLAPCVPLIVFCLALLVLNRTRHVGFVAPVTGETLDHTTLEIVLGLSFLALPIIGVTFAIIVHAPVIARYFLPALIGLCIVVGTTFGRKTTAPWISIILATAMTLTIGAEFGRLVWHRYNGWGENLIEPISGRPMNTAPGHPLDRYQLLMSKASDSPEPIGIVTVWDFVYLVNYAPDLRSRLYYINISEKDFFYRALRDLRPWGPVKYNSPVTYDELCRQTPAFLIYGLYRDYEMDELSKMTEGARTVKSLKVSDGHFMAEMTPRLTAGLDDPTRIRTK